MLPISKSYIGSLCEIKTINNNLLTSGYIEVINDEYIEIRFREDIKMLIQADILVKVSIINEKLGFKVIVGKVYVGTNDFVRIIEVVTLMDFEKREFFRINIFEHASLYLNPVTADETFYTREPSVKILINNISLNGVYFISKDKFNIGTKLYLLLEITSGRIVFPCIVQRLTNEIEDKWGHGCEFVDYNQRQSDQLYKFIFEKQLEFLKKNHEDKF